MPVVFYGRGTWSLIMEEEHMLRVFENRMPREISLVNKDFVP